MRRKLRGFIVPTLSAIDFLIPKSESSLLRILRLSLVASIGFPISLALRWSESSTRFLLRSVLGLGRQPALFYQAVNSLLLAKVQVEEVVAYGAKLLLGFAILQITPEAFQLKETASGESHNEDSSSAEVPTDGTAFSTLSYYQCSEMPGTLAVVRYHARDDHDRTTAVAEDMFFDTPEDFCKLQDDVEEALLTGIDVCVMSNHPPETFEEIAKYLTVNEDGDVEV